MDWGEKTRIVLTCGRGCAGAVVKELARLGYSAETAEDGSAAETEGNLRGAMRMNLWLRTANRVLFEVGAFEAGDAEELYEGVAGLPWELWLRDDVPIHWRGAARAEGLRDSRYALLKCKDAVADRFREKRGRRPDASKSPAGASCLSLQWDGEFARIFLDTSGESLSNRGYRLEGWAAPVRETLAAAVLVEAGFDPEKGDGLAAPMCGSGTFAVEGAWMAQRRAPGLGREEWPFLRYNEAPAGMWRELVEEAREAFRAAPGGWFGASDIDGDAVAAAHRNAVRAGVEKMIRLERCDFRESALPPGPGVVAMNPEWGERLGDARELEGTYRAIGDWLKREATGKRAAVLTGNAALGRAIGLKPAKRAEVWNGPIECRLLIYELYEGTRDWRLLAKRSGETILRNGEKRH
jgi:putative N6-adenine-specific DNA methylase